MKLEDNFKVATPDWLVDPVLKIRVNTSGHKESGSADALLHATFDPEIRPERLTVPPPPEQRARRLAIPSLAHLADEPNIFQSSQSIPFMSIGFGWTHSAKTIQYKIEEGVYQIELLIDRIENLGLPIVSERAEDVVCLCLQSILKLQNIKLEPVLGKHPDARRLEVWVRKEVAERLHCRRTEELEGGEPGWVCIASREIDR